ncbi:hypothetical protein ACFQH2_19740 [Natronoarchaeum sp. GCM10025703]|uniref:hypothetical protein n=1 Tax=unclassified Natronoarchaeum TaxID=2620183 RepID=UPI003609491C
MSESEMHQKLKSLAVSALRQRFEGEYSRCDPETVLKVPNTATRPDTRYADALVEFDSENRYYGKGIIVEVQYKNHAKDKFATTHDYLASEFSVIWADPSDFEEDRFRFSVVDRRSIIKAIRKGLQSTTTTQKSSRRRLARASSGKNRTLIVPTHGRIWQSTVRRTSPVRVVG